MLERSDELALMEDALVSARRGMGALVMLEGEPGVGRTLLLTAVRDRAHVRGDVVVHARASALEQEFPFAIVRQLFEAKLIAATGAEREALLGGRARLAAPLFELGSNGAGSGESEYETLQGLHWLCANVAGERALLVAIDDVQWADAPSLRFVHYLLGRLEELPVLVALARCTGEPAAEHELLTAIGASPGSQVVRPRPLSAAAVGELLADALGTPATSSLAEGCLEATGGNPLLLRAVLDELPAEPAAEDPAQTIGAIGPPAIAGDVRQRLERCSPHAVALAQAIAVLEPAAQLRHAAALAGLDETTAEQTAGTLADHGVLCAGEPCRFLHPVVRTAIYEGVATADRARSHAHAGRLLTAEDAPAELIAEHLVRTNPSCGGPWMLPVLRGAAQAALADGRPGDAVAYLQRALAEPGCDDRGDVLAQLGRVELSLSHPVVAAEHLAGALELIDDHGRRAEIGVDLGRALILADRCREAVRRLDGLIAELADAGRPAPRLEAELAAATPVDHRTEPLLGERVSRMPATANAGTSATRVLLANAAFEAAIEGDDARRAADLARRALDGGALLDEDGSESVHYYRAAWTLAMCDDIDAADEALSAAASNARVRGSRLGAAAASCFQAATLARRGQLPEADAAADCALAAAGEGWRVGVLLAAAFRTSALLERDQLAEAAALIERTGMAHAIPDSTGSRLVRFERGRVRIAMGQLEEGLEDLMESGSDQRGGRVRGLAIGAWHAETAAALARLERHDEAERVVDEALKLTRAFGAPSARATALRAAGLVASGDRGPKLIAEAVALLRRSPARLELARSLVDLGAALRRRNRRSAARTQLHAALDVAERCGAITLARRARTELQAAGTRPRRPVRRGVDALTASERRVAELAAGGLSNRAIAQQLFVTVKTVEWHLGQTYRKLDVGSRKQLPAVLGAAVAGTADDAGDDARVAPDANRS